MPSARSAGKLEVGQPFNPFGMFLGSWLPEWLERRSEVTLAAKVVYARLGRYLGANGQHAYPRQEVLADALGVSRETVNKALGELESYHLIEKTRRGLGRSNTYVFLWHDWAEECFTSRSEESSHQDVEERHNQKSENATSQGKTVSEDSQGKLRKGRGFRRPVEEPEAPALGADPDAAPPPDLEQPRSTRVRRNKTESDLVAYFVSKLDQRPGPKMAVAAKGKTVFVGAARRMLAEGVTVEQIKAMVDAMVARYDAYVEGTNTPGQAFNYKGQELLDHVRKRKSRSTYDVSKSSSEDDT